MTGSAEPTVVVCVDPIEVEAPVEIGEFQRLMRDTYGQRDRDRGLERTFAWLVEEVGELSRALFRRRDEDALRIEVADVLAWLVSLADQAGVDVAAAAQRYAAGCPKCDATPCVCAPG